MRKSGSAKTFLPNKPRSALAAIAKNVTGLITLAGLGAVIYFYLGPWTQTTAWPWAKGLFNRPGQKPAETILVVRAIRRTALPADYRIYLDGRIVGAEEWPGYSLSAPIHLPGPNEVRLALAVLGATVEGKECLGIRKGKEWQLKQMPGPTVKEYRFQLKPGSYDVEVAIPNCEPTAHRRPFSDSASWTFPLSDPTTHRGDWARAQPSRRCQIPQPVPRFG
jgi:hypothetical protein